MSKPWKPTRGPIRGDGARAIGIELHPEPDEAVFQTLLESNVHRSEDLSHLPKVEVDGPPCVGFDVPREGRLLVVGDPHGQAKAFAALVELLEPGPADRLWLVGDLIDRGPGSRDPPRLDRAHRDPVPAG